MSGQCIKARRNFRIDREEMLSVLFITLRMIIKNGLVLKEEKNAPLPGIQMMINIYPVKWE